MKKINILKAFIFFLLVISVFKAWFFLNPISSGDWGFFYNSSLKEFSIISNSWNNVFNSGLGGSNFIILGLFFYFSSTIYFLFNFFKFDWLLIERIAWFWPFLIISVFSSYFLFKELFSNRFAVFSSSIYLFNTYVLMLVGGGQMGVALSYSIAPLVLYSFIKLNENIKLKYSILFGILFGILVMFDLRITYIMLPALGIYFLFNIKQLIFGKDLKEIIVNISYIFIIPFAVSGLLHAFWILPLLALHQNPAQSFGVVYTSAEAVKFFSFAKFEDAVGLLHPNWSENIFGKVGFLKPEFLLLPVLAFSSLLFVSKTKDLRFKIYVLYFALLGLIGAFLAKGANEPFGGIYLWMFDYVPGFIMFRDPTKWYTLVAISYSILIPFSIWKIYEWLKSRSKFSIKSKIFNASNLFLLVIVFCLLFLIRPALFGQLSGTFKATTIPDEYIKFEKFLSSDNNFSRILWVPTLQRFGYYSNLHPAIPAQDFFKTVDYSQIIKKIRTSEGEKLLQEAGVRYIIVPYDSQGEIFLKDRKYNNEIYKKTINEIKQISYLKQVNDFGKIAVFEIPNPRDHFWTISKSLTLKYKYVSPVEYRLEVINAKKGDIIVFSESYDASWIARESNARFYDWSNLISSNPYSRIFNSFASRKDGNYSLIIYYYPQILVNIGMIVSGLTLILILSALIYLRKENK